MTLQLPVAPHRLGSIIIPEVLTTEAFTPGGARIRVPLLAKGYLDHLRVRITGTVTAAAGDASQRPGFPHNIVRRFMLDGPGLRDTYDLDGIHAKMQGSVIGYPKTMAHAGDVPTLPQTTASAVELFSVAERGPSTADTYPTAVAVNVWDLRWTIDPKRSHRDHRGMIPLVASEELVLTIDPGALGEIFNTPATVTGTALTVSVVQYMRTPPVAGVQSPDTGWRVKYSQQDLPAGQLAAGANADVKIAQEGILLNALAFVVLDDDVFPSNPVASIESISHIVNEDKRRDVIPPWVFLDEQNAKYDRSLPHGWFAFDGDADQADIPYLDGGFERQPGWVKVPEGRQSVLRFRLTAGAALDAPRIVTSTKRLVRV